MIAFRRLATQDMRHRTTSHLRAYRRSRGLTQSELAFLFGGQSTSNISRSERSGRTAGLDVAFACQVIFGIDPHEIYPGLYEYVREQVIDRMHQLHEQLQNAPRTARTLAKLKLLESALRRAGELIEQHSV